MIDVKQAVASAFKFITDLYGADAAKDARLEEVELEEAGNHWLVTLSFFDPQDAARTPTAVSRAMGLDDARHYKLFRIAADNGAVQAMRIRERV